MLRIEETWDCDYRNCEESHTLKKPGRRGENPFLPGDIPPHTEWVKISVQSSGRMESLHFCSQDCAEKEMNLLTQQGIPSPEPQKLLESA